MLFTNKKYPPTKEILQDVIITQQEIDQIEYELVSLRNDPIKNKMAIYMREGHILNRKDFITKLNGILNTL